MKLYNCCSFFVIFFLVLGCAQEKQTERAQGGDTPEGLIGTWQLVSYINHDAGDTDWSKYGDNIIYQKYITPTHFTWVSYDKDNEDLTGMGGGTYTYDGQTYTEDINFFVPPGSNELGQAIPFDVEFKDGKWYHTGYAKVIEFDPETGDNVVTDSSKIEEIWAKVEMDNPMGDWDIQGTWKLTSYKEDAESGRLLFPEFVKYIKLVTPTHFCWVQYNAEGDEVLAAGSGPFVFKDGKYVETLKVLYPQSAGQVDTELPFDINLENNQWLHQGHVVRTLENDEGQPYADTLLIDEIWEPYDAPMEEPASD